MSDETKQAAASSEPQTCVVCLEVAVNESKLDCCHHVFCNACIRQWSKKKHQCPLCRRRFRKITDSEDRVTEIKQFTLRPPIINNRLANSGTIALLRTIVPNGRGASSSNGSATPGSTATDDSEDIYQLVRLHEIRRPNSFEASSSVGQNAQQQSNGNLPIPSESTTVMYQMDVIDDDDADLPSTSTAANNRNN